MQYLRGFSFVVEISCNKSSVPTRTESLASLQRLQYLILSHASNTSKTSSLKSLYLRLKERSEEEGKQGQLLLFTGVWDKAKRSRRTSSPACSGTAAPLGPGLRRKRRLGCCCSVPDSSKSWWLLKRQTGPPCRRPSGQSFQRLKKYINKNTDMSWMLRLLLQSCDLKIKKFWRVELTPAPPTDSLDVQQPPTKV